MNKNFKIIGLFFLFSIFTLVLYNQTIKIPKVNAQANIIVVGEGYLTVKPDMAILSFGIESKNENLSTAIDQNNEKIKELNLLLNENGFFEEDITRTGYTVFQKYSYENGEKFLGHQVRTSFEIKVKVLEDLNTLIKDLTEIGVNKIDGVTLTCANKNEIYKQSIKLALENAKDKAKALSDNQLDVKRITEEVCYINNLYRDAKLLNSDNLLNGSITICAKLLVEFEEII